MHLFFICTAFLLLAACSIRNDGKSAAVHAAHPVKQVKTDTTEDSTHFSGRVAKVVYPSNQACKDSLTEYSFNCLGTELTIHVPCNYLRTDFFQYTEGEILIIHYPDASSISILCGTQASFSNAEASTNGLHHKNVIVKGYQLTYSNVPEQKLRLFDTAFELLEKDIK